MMGIRRVVFRIDHYSRFRLAEIEIESMAVGRIVIPRVHDVLKRDRDGSAIDSLSQTLLEVLELFRGNEKLVVRDSHTGVLRSVSQNDVVVEVGNARYPQFIPQCKQGRTWYTIENWHSSSTLISLRRRR